MKNLSKYKSIAKSDLRHITKSPTRNSNAIKRSNPFLITSGVMTSPDRSRGLQNMYAVRRKRAVKTNYRKKQMYHKKKSASTNTHQQTLEERGQTSNDSTSRTHNTPVTLEIDKCSQNGTETSRKISNIVANQRRQNVRHIQAVPSNSRRAQAWTYFSHFSRIT